MKLISGADLFGAFNALGNLKTELAVMTERAAVVAWLRAQATCGCNGAHGRCLEDDPPLAYADAIERGEHAAQGMETRQGGDANAAPGEA